MINILQEISFIEKNINIKYFRIFKLILLFFVLNHVSLICQYPLTKLVPQPRQAYIREEFSAVFSFSPAMKLYLNQEEPAFRQAYEFNRELIKRGIDSLEYALLDINDTMIVGVAIGYKDERLNQLLSFIPDQKIEVNSQYPGKEGYVLDVLPMQTIIAGSDEQGLHYGILTFFQLLDTLFENNSILALRIIDAPEFPVRWVYYPTNFLVGANIDKLKPIWSNCSDMKLNGMLTGDYKWAFISEMQQRYIDSLKSTRDFAKDKYLDMVCGIFSFGYSGDILYHNPNWASGLPVKWQKFVIEGDTGRLVPSVDVSLSNGGLESYNGNNFTGFGFIDDPGIRSFVDTEVKHSGNASIRFSDFSNPQRQGTNARLNKRVKVNPFTLYHMSAWVKTENLTSGYITQMLVLGKKGNALNYAYINVPSTTDWKKVDISFNSLDNDTINIYWGTWDAKTGSIWWDDLVFEEIAFVNMLRRPGTPINVSHQFLDIAYSEGVDYDSLIDPKMGRIHGYGGDYDSWHQPPTFRRKTDGNIHNGDTLIMSYYHAVVIYDDQVMITMSDPDVYTKLEEQFQIVDSILKPKTYFMNHDEIRVMNWDYGDQSRGLTPAQILADNVGKCVDIIRRHNTFADIWVWSDMFDEYHNAKKSGYYLVNGDLTGSADIISKEIGIANWNSGKHEQSLDFFSLKGFRQISAPYYDQDENNIRIWKEWTQDAPDFKGMIYTTWQQKYTHLEPFAEYSWNHAPYLYHYPVKRPPKGELFLPISLEGDRYDTSWAFGEASLHYRTDKTSVFAKVEIDTITSQGVNVPLTLQENNDFLQYYFEAKDNRGWVTKIPFGNEKYFELGKLPVNVQDCQNQKYRIYPNPVKSGDIINISTDDFKTTDTEIKLFDILGREILISFVESEDFIIRFKTDDMVPGMYFIKLKQKANVLVERIVIY
ncbi:MAG: T9SS type A sorting domain-containing protein [bacterium]